MFGVWDLENEGFIVSVDNEGCCTGENAIIFEAEELAEAFLIWMCAWLGDDEGNYSIKAVVI